MPFRGIPYWSMPKEIKAEAQKKITLSKMVEKNPRWRGDDVGYRSLHEWVANRKPKPALCEQCHVNPPLDLTNINGDYKRDLDGWKWLCRRCHMQTDGRMKNLKQFREEQPNA